MKRDRLEIIAQILHVAKKGIKKTHVMYQCNLSYSQTKDFINSLMETGLLRIGNSYHTTDKGLKFLRAYETLNSLSNTRI
jgi:predicted transcriptional regulator